MQDVAHLMHAYTDLVQDMPRAVEFPFISTAKCAEDSKLPMECGPVVAATLFEQVVDLLDCALESILQSQKELIKVYNQDKTLTEEKLRAEGAYEQGDGYFDRTAHQLLGIHIPARLIMPQNTSKPYSAPKETIEILREKFAHCLELPRDVTRGVELPRLSFVQYFTLLAMNFHAPEVELVINRCKDKAVTRGLASMHPLNAYFHEICPLIARLEAQQGDEEVVPEKLLVAKKSLMATRQALLLRRKAKSCVQEGDFLEAIDVLTTALALHADTVEELDEEETEGSGCLPSYLRVSLFVERCFSLCYKG